MEHLKGACVIGQSGGPTSVFNASALGVIETALKNENITQVLAAENGLSGILEDRLFDCGLEDPKELAKLKTTPGSALGSCRRRLPEWTENEDDYLRILRVFQKHNVRYFFYNGGNDSMDTCEKVSRYLAEKNYPCNVIGVPKTIDNDLCGTDHCPGFGSAAKYIAACTSELSREAYTYESGTVLILEIMGRNAGWLTAAASLASVIGEGPDFVYLPEVPFSPEQFISDIAGKLKTQKSVICAVAEGVKTIDGKYVTDGGVLQGATDVFGHTQMGGLAAQLAAFVKDSLHIKTRGIEFSLLQRCASHCASMTDIEEAYLAGKTAVEAAVSGVTGKMVGFARKKDTEEYICETILSDLSLAANAENKIPTAWINDTHNGLNDQFIAYALPLIQGDPAPFGTNGLPAYPKLKKIRA